MSVVDACDMVEVGMLEKGVSISDLMLVIENLECRQGVDRTYMEYMRAFKDMNVARLVIVRVILWLFRKPFMMVRKSVALLSLLRGEEPTRRPSSHQMIDGA